MYLTVQNAATYCYTGGQPFDVAKPTVVFIHGVLCDHSVWLLQSRSLAHQGFNVLAIDLPGHCRSAGETPASVPDAADFIGALLDAAGVQRAALVGHSWGSLIALEAAARLGSRISHLVLIGTASPMRVSAVLLQDSVNAPLQAIQLVNVLSRSKRPPVPSAADAEADDAQVALASRVLASNSAVNVFQRGLLACDSYAGGVQAAAQITCPVLFVLGEQDRMTPPKAAASLISAARDSGKTVQVVHLPTGHNLMTDAPEQTLAALSAFLGA